MNNRFTNIIFGTVVLVAVMTLLFWLFQSVVTLLQWVAPVLLIITLIMDRQVVFDYVKMIGSKLKNDTLWGIGLVVLTVFGFPFVSAYLFFKAFLRRKVKQMETKNDTYGGKFIEYEEIEETLDLSEPPIILSPKQSKEDEYDSYFE